MIPLFGLIFAGLGLYLMLGRCWVDAHLRKRTHYALTNERLLLSGGWDGQQIKTLLLRSLPQLAFQPLQALAGDGAGEMSMYRAGV